MGYSTSGAGVCRVMLIILNILFFILGLAVCAGGIYMFVQEIKIRQIVGSDLYEAAIFVTFGSGIATVIISLLGILGASKRHKILLIIYFVCLIFIFLLMAIGGILAIVFQANIERTMKEKMQDTLVKDYGRRRLITDAWDWTQLNLECCAVDTKKWSLYQSSEWFKDQKGPNVNTVSQKYVPESCCVRKDDKVVNAYTCQNFPQNPPNVDVGKETNQHLHSIGCYDAGRQYIVERSWIIFGIGLGIAFCLIIGLIISVCVFRTLG